MGEGKKREGCRRRKAKETKHENMIYFPFFNLLLFLTAYVLGYEREECIKTDVGLQSLPTDSLRRKTYIKNSLCGH